MGDGATGFSRLPAIGALVDAPQTAPLIKQFGRTIVTAAARKAVDDARQRILCGETIDSVGADEVAAAARALTRPSLRRVINGTGVIVHTNLGRAPLADAAQQAVIDIMGGYSTLEYDVASGERGSRHAHVRSLISELVGAESGLAINNCAGAVLLMLAAICEGREVIIARGEQVEIGGGFRVPDVMRQSGAKMVEVGTTNKVHLRDYEAALSENTAAILSVHRSNFAIVGFTSQPTTRELAEVAHRHDVPLLVDLGSGLIAPYEACGVAADAVRSEPRPQDTIAAGADVIAFSGDKLLGGPQAGIVAGRTGLIEQIARHPLARALRADKMTIAALEATLRLYRAGRLDEIPVLQDLSAPADVLRARAERLVETLKDACPDLPCAIVGGDSVVGGGTLPLSTLPTFLVALGRSGAAARALAEGLRSASTPVITRMVDDRCVIDVRTIEDAEIVQIAEAAEAATAG